MLYKILFSAAFSLALLAPAAAQNTAAPLAQTSNAAGDTLIVEMNKAFRRGDKARLAQLLPHARGHTPAAGAPSREPTAPPASS